MPVYNQYTDFWDISFFYFTESMIASVFYIAYLSSANFKCSIVKFTGGSYRESGRLKE